jgi:hypothetical protein
MSGRHYPPCLRCTCRMTSGLPLAIVGHPGGKIFWDDRTGGTRVASVTPLIPASLQPSDRGITMTVKPSGVVGAVIFFVCFVLWPAAPTYAEWPSIQAPKGRSSGIAQKFPNALRNQGAHHHQTASPPLPPPAELSAELNRAAPKVTPASEAPRPLEAKKVPEGGPAPQSDQTDANRIPTESAAIGSARVSAEAAAPVEVDETPAAEPAPVSGSNKATQDDPAVSNKPAEAAAPVPIND